MLRTVALAVVLTFLVSAPAALAGPPMKVAVITEFDLTKRLEEADSDLPWKLRALLIAGFRGGLEVVDKEVQDKVCKAEQLGTAGFFQSSNRSRKLGLAVKADLVFTGSAFYVGEKIVAQVRVFETYTGRNRPTVTGSSMSLEELPELLWTLAKKAVSAPKPPPDKSPAAAGVAGFLENLTARDAGVRFSAAVELGKLGDKSAAAALVKVLENDKDTFVRRAAARSLGELDAWAAVPALIGAMGDPEFFVAVTAHAAAKKIADHDFGFRQDLSRAEMGSVVKLAREWWETHKADRTE